MIIADSYLQKLLGFSYQLGKTETVPVAKNNRSGQSAILSESDYARIRKQLINPAHRLIFDIARYTGERWGAIVQLAVRDVYDKPEFSLPRAEITFTAATRKANPDGKRSTRQVPVHPTLADLLCVYNPPLAGYLFVGQSEGRHLTFSAADKALKRAIDHAALEGKGISTHSTRRTLITELSESGTDLKTMQAITGHKDSKSLLRYVEVSPDRVKGAIARLWTA